MGQGAFLGPRQYYRPDIRCSMTKSQRGDSNRFLRHDRALLFRETDELPRAPSEPEGWKPAIRNEYQFCEACGSIF
jgi:hypothetical protein